MTTVNQLMSAVPAVICVTQSLDDAATLVSTGETSGGETAVLVIGLAHQPVGLITGTDLAEIAARHPAGWRKKRCACLISEDLDFLRPDDPVEGVLGRYRTDGVKPLLVLNGTDAVGILYPEVTFAWCAEQRSPVLSGTTAASEHTPGPDQPQLNHQREPRGHSP